MDLLKQGLMAPDHSEKFIWSDLFLFKTRLILRAQTDSLRMEKQQLCGYFNTWCHITFIHSHISPGPHNHAVKSIILKNFKLFQNDSETVIIFSQPPLISFKRDKKQRQPFGRKFISYQWPTYNFQMRSLTMQNLLYGLKRSIKITVHFTGTSANVIYCLTRT